jgi:hypothetical protein
LRSGFALSRLAAVELAEESIVDVALFATDPSPRGRLSSGGVMSAGGDQNTLSRTTIATNAAKGASQGNTRCQMRGALGAVASQTMLPGDADRNPSRTAAIVISETSSSGV